MRSVRIFEVKTKLSGLLRLGEPIEITSHKKKRRSALSQTCIPWFGTNKA